MTGLPACISESKKLRVTDHDGHSIVTGDCKISSFNDKWVLFVDVEGFKLVPWTAIRYISPKDVHPLKEEPAE